MTQPDGAGQKKTLTTQQDSVLLGLLAGKTLSDAAREAGVSRQAASGWRNHDLVFQEALFTRQRERREELYHRLEIAGEQALATIRELLGTDHEPKVRLDAASRILEILGPKPRPPSRRRIAMLRHRRECADIDTASSALAAETEKVRAEVLGVLGRALAAKNGSPSGIPNAKPPAATKPPVPASR